MLQAAAASLIALNSDMETSLGMRSHYDLEGAPPESAMTQEEQQCLAYFMADLSEFMAPATVPETDPAWVVINRDFNTVNAQTPADAVMVMPGFTYYVFADNHDLVTMICS